MAGAADLGTSSVGSKTNNSTNTPSSVVVETDKAMLVPMVATQTTPRNNALVAVRRPRGRPAGSKNKLKPPFIITRESANALRAHVMEVSPGCDVSECISSFAHKKQRGVCVLGVSGCVANVTLRQPGSSNATVTLHGQFEILSLLGSVFPPPAPAGVNGLTVYLSGAQGQVMGGAVVGALVALGPVVVMAASFITATFDHLPLQDGDENNNQNHHRHQYSHHQQQQQHMELTNLYGGVPANFLSNGSLPPELYSWAPGRQLSKR